MKIAEQESRLLDLLRQQQHHTGTTDTLALPDVSTIGSYLPHDGALLEYYLADTTLWGVLLHAQGACSLRMLGTWGNAEQELLEDLDLFFAGVVPTSTAKRDSPSHTSTTDSVHKRLHRLWQLLIAPWGPLPPSLCIAPHSSLGHVPFAALWDGTHYLGAQHTIATFPTGALLAVPPPPPTVQSPSLVLGYTDHGRLPGVQREALLVGQMVPEAQVYTEAQAQSEVLRSLITPPMLLHIAAHAEVRRDAPLFSFIRLSDGDMALESWYDLPLHTTRLVVLSACNTGRIADPGSTLLAFQGALLGAGVQTLVSSLWEANDEATEILMREFYRVWLDGTAPAQALHQAQQALREQPAFSHPAMWASFICGGPGSFRNHK